MKIDEGWEWRYDNRTSLVAVQNTVKELIEKKGEFIFSLNAYQGLRAFLRMNPDYTYQKLGLTTAIITRRSGVA